MQKIVRFLGSPAGLVLRYGVSLALIAVLALQVDWRQLARLDERLAAGPLVAALVLALLAFPVCALRWWLLLRATGAELPLARAHAVTWVGQFYNAFLPGGIGGDATRLLYAFRDRPDRKAAATAATAADRALGFLVLTALAAGAVALVAGPSTHAGTGRIALTLGAVAAGLATVAWLFAVVAAPRLPPVWADTIVRLRGAPGAVVHATLLSAAVWLLDFASGWCLALSLGICFDPFALAAALALAYLSTLLPISLGGHGLREGSLVLALQWFGQDGPAGMEGLAAFALLFLTVSLATSLVGGGVLLLMRRSPAR